MTTDKAHTLPCPPWCTTDGHGSQLVEHDPDGYREHSRLTAALEWTPSQPGSTTHVAIYLSQGETAVIDEEGVRLDVEPVEIVLNIGEYATMTGPQARQLAAALVDAAGLWEVAR